jgi:hypothetical protein
MRRAILRTRAAEAAWCNGPRKIARQLAHALICRDNRPQNKAADAIGCSQRKLCYLLPETRQNLADILNRLDLL